MINSKASERSYFIIWLLALAPLVGTALQTSVSIASHIELSSLLFIPITMNIILAIYDAENLKREGLYSKKMGNPILVPIYIFKRAKLLNHPPLYTLAWYTSIGIIIMTPDWKWADLVNSVFHFY